MSSYVAIGRERRAEMLAEVGLKREDLFAHVPESLKLKSRNFEKLQNEGLTEQELLAYFAELADQNARLDQYDAYLGAGFYDHTIPAALPTLIGRQEFLTAYTPYQQEISQGTLQATYEWQSFICRLTGLDVANSSMYDAASAAAEAALMAFREKKKATKVWVSASVHPQTIETIKSYLEANDLAYEIGAPTADGTSAGSYPEGKDYAAFIVQNPNYYGLVEDLQAMAEQAHAQGALAVAIADPMALALLKPVAEQGIDIAVGEAQAFGVNPAYGGPTVAYMACKEALVRKMPGRICGATVDRNGERSFVLTLQAREQHIRRERATSNICTSQALLATSATIWLSLMGRDGLHKAAYQSQAKAMYLQEQLLATGLFEKAYDGPFFREFALKPKDGVCLKSLNKALLEEKILGGVITDEGYWLLAVTEKKSKAAMDRFVDKVKALAKK